MIWKDEDIYLLPAEINGVFKQSPDNGFIAVGCSQGTNIAKVLVHIVLRKNEHVQGHTGHSSVTGWVVNKII